MHLDAVLTGAPSQLVERTIGGLHDFLMAEVLPKYARRGMRILDLGAGSGALSQRLQQLGLDVRAVDADQIGFGAQVPFFHLDLNQPDFASHFGQSSIDLITSVEVIEHLESPINFLRNICHLLKPHGVAVITTPNVDNVPARIKFLLKGKIRLLDDLGDPTHISPIFWDLLRRQYLPLAELELVERYFYPPSGYKVTRRRFAWFLRLLALCLPGENLLGDNHILVLRARRKTG